MTVPTVPPTAVRSTGNQTSTASRTPSPTGTYTDWRRRDLSTITPWLLDIARVGRDGRRRTLRAAGLTGGLGAVHPDRVGGHRQRLVSSAFIGLPCPMNAAGIDSSVTANLRERARSPSRRPRSAWASGRASADPPRAART